MEDLVLPGDLMHLLMRKYYIREEIERARNEGYHQVVVLGSGLDYSAIRTAKFELHSFEVDEPDTITLKRKLVEEIHFNHPLLHFVPVDIHRQGLFDAALRK